ncbi:MAG: sugar ABC transporter ATP-binding protein [Treponema sp.]|jgi:ribose transport system ATP-binding protein|nr:sugar ABC transporter ATP-binding protein [Treponema sp.]
MGDVKYSLQCRNVCKSFGSNVVLQDVNLDVAHGEVHALLGQNGAGKSTLVKILTGVYSRDSGEIMVEEQPVHLETPGDAEKLGIAIIHQDQQMVPQFDVTRNAFLGLELKTRLGTLDFKAMAARVSEKLALIKAPFTADTQVSSLTVGQREQVAIAAALLQEPRILILDEPTASLSAGEVERLFEVIAMLKAAGVTIIYISHHLDEVFRICDSITILRDSRVQGSFPVKEVTHEKVVTMMIGRKLEEFFPKELIEIGAPVLEVKNLKNEPMVQDVSFALHAGEILGFAGLVGAGRTEAMMSLYSGGRKVTGEFLVNGAGFIPKSPQAARKQGFAFIPEDRRNEGIVANLTIAQNLSLAFTDLLARTGIISRSVEQEKSSRIIDNLGIVCVNQSQLVKDLSGGNQQKVVIGRWLEGSAKIFVFDQPTTGVDVGAKTEIYRQMVKLAKAGCGVMFISSENEELLGMCDRIMVMSKGRVVKELDRSEATEEQLLFWSSGGNA